jgi:hypothetical protein
MPDDVFTVAMLDILREPFQHWLTQRGLTMSRIPHSDMYAIVPAPGHPLLDGPHGDQSGDNLPR